MLIDSSREQYSWDLNLHSWTQSCTHYLGVYVESSTPTSKAATNLFQPKCHSSESSWLTLKSKFGPLPVSLSYATMSF